MSLSVCIAPSCSLLAGVKLAGGNRQRCRETGSPGFFLRRRRGGPDLHTLAAGDSNALAPGGAMHVISAGNVSASIKRLIESYDGGDRETAGRRLGIAPD